MAQRTQPGAGRPEGSGAHRGTKRNRPSRREPLLSFEPRKRAVSSRPGKPKPPPKPPSKVGRPRRPPHAPIPPAPPGPATEPEAPPRERSYPPWQLVLLILAYGVQFFWLFCTRPARHIFATMMRHPEGVPVVLSLFGGLALFFIWHRCRWAGWIVLLVGLLELTMLRPWSAVCLLYATWALAQPSVHSTWR